MWIDYPDENLLDETPVPRLHITDIEPAFDTISQQLDVYCAGFWKDTAYLVRWSPNDDSLIRLAASAGRDNDNSGSWQPEFRVAGVVDYDIDGHDELFFFLNSVRDISPRMLICVETNPFRIAWTLPVASPVFEVFSCHDSVDPGILFITSPPGQGAVDSRFSDNWGYLVRVDTAGQVAFSRVIGRYPVGSQFRESVSRGVYYLTHRLPVSTDTMALLETAPGSILSKIDARGTVLAQYQTSTAVSGLWTDPWEGVDSELVYLRLRTGIIKQFDRSLQLQAESDSCELTELIGWIPRFDGHEPAVVMQENADAVGVYDRKFRKLAGLPHFNTLDVLRRGTHGEVTALAMSRGGGTYLFARFDRRGLLFALSTFYRNNQVYVLSVLFGAMAAFIVSNFYRHRTKKNLSIIRTQKVELERIHQALQEAQQTIIAQEKYRQAKDIAGGFAHEIRNALFPADGAMVRLRRLAEEETLDRAKAAPMLGSIDTAVARAIGITEQISQYTKLDSLYSPESIIVADVVAEVVRAARTRLESETVTLHASGDEHISVVCNRGQLFSVINNLVINSLDALAGRPNPMINITWSASGETMELKVEDNGPGIRSEDFERIFDTFFSTKPNRGTGLGLAIVKKTVEMYGGAVQVTSQLNCGTIFTVRLKSAIEMHNSTQKGGSAGSAPNLT